MGNLSENISLVESCSDNGPDSEIQFEKDHRISSIESQPPEKSNVFPIFQKNYRPKENQLKSLQRAIQKTRPRKKYLLGKKETPGLSQLVLDAGQKRIGPMICPDCGLLYSPGDIEDEEEHRKAHAKLENLHTVMLWKNPCIVANFLDGAFIIAVKKIDQNKQALRKLRHFMEWIESELGIVSSTQDENNPEQIFLYACPSKRKNYVRILGYTSVEIMRKGSVLARSLASTEEAPWINDVPVQIGITRLWTDPGFRRKKIATKLVDNMRFHTGIPGHVVAKDNVGMYEPNADGTAFLRTFTDSKGWCYTYVG